MPEEFDPYLHWLGIRDPQRPPNHYRLLGVELFESDPDVISNAADRQMAHVRTFQSGRRSAESQKVLNALAGAKICLLNPQKKAGYDAQLQAELASVVQPPVMPSPSEAIAPALPPSLPSPTVRRFSVLWVTLSTLVAVAAMMAALLIVVLGVGHAPDEDRDLARSDDEVTADAGQQLQPPGGPVTDEPKLDQGANPQPGKQLDAKQAAKTTAEPAAKVEPPKKIEPPGKAEPKGAKRTETAKTTEPGAKSEAKSPTEQLPPAAESMTAARTAMKQRNVDAARRHLVLAEKAAFPKDREQLDRLNDVLTPWEAFWTAVRLGILECKQGEVLRAERLSVEVVNRADGVITVRGDVDGKKGTARGDVDGKERTITFRLQNLPTPLAMVIAEKKLPENTANLPKAAFLVVDPDGDPRQAFQLCEQSARRGVAPSSGLAAELKAALAATNSPPGADAASAKPPSRLPVPDAAAQQDERKKVRDAFRARFAQARTPIDRGDLAADLFRDAQGSKDSPAARFALFAEARDLALAAGEPARFREVVLEMAKGYELDSFEEQTRALVDASDTALPSAVRTTLAKVAIDLAQEAIQADSYDAAARLAKASFSFASKVMASKGRDPHTIRQAIELGETIPWYKQQHDLAQQAEKALTQDPNNIKAVQFLGKYYALVKEQWDRGLPLLLKSEDARLKALAEAEQAARRSASAADMVKLADQWMEAVPSIEGPLERSAQRRALYWYEAALPHLSGLTQQRVVRAIDALKQWEPPRRK